MNKNFILILNLIAILVCTGEALFANDLSACEKNCNRLHSSIYHETRKNVMEQELYAWTACMDKCNNNSKLVDD